MTAATPVPVYATFGEGSRLCVVMSPVQATWDQGAFCLPLAQLLVPRGFTVVVFDSLSLPGERSSTLNQLVAQWGEYLEQQFLRQTGPVDLLVGDALGGAVVQGLLGLPIGRTARRALVFSGPTLSDRSLANSLERLSQLALSGMVVTSLALLNQLVQPSNPAGLYPMVSPAAPADMASASIRLGLGFALLKSVDFRFEVFQYGGSLVAMVGCLSQLVAERNVVVAPSGRQRRIGIPDGGMRPLTDDLPLVRREVLRLLSE